MDEMLAKDLAAIWQSELTAMAADRELREAALALGTFWANAALAAMAPAAAPGPADDGTAGGAPRGGAAAAQPARATAAAAASEPGLDADLGWRIAELEQRLAKLERNRPGPARPGKLRPRLGKGGGG